MKRIAILLLAAACLLAGCSRGQKFTVNGTLRETGFKGATGAKIEYELMEGTLQAPFTDTTFTIKGKVKKPIIAKLSAVGTEKRITRYFILEKGTISFHRGMAQGTPLNDSTYAFTQKVFDTAHKYTGQKERQVKAIEDVFSDFVSRHKDDPCAVYAIVFGYQKLRKEFMRDLIKSTSPAIQNDGEVHAVKTGLSLPF